MTIIFYTNNSDRNVARKNISEVVSVDGYFRKGSSISDPIVDIDHRNINSILGLSNVNYCYIQEYGRYYYIASVENVRTHLWRYYLHVDVLMSFYAQYSTNNAIIARQENLFNLYLPDSKLITKMTRNIIVKKFPNVPVTGQGIDTKSIVLTVAGYDE